MGVSQEMQVWNLPKAHLSSLPSPLPPNGTTPFSDQLLPQHTWESGGSYDKVLLGTVDTRGSSEGHRGLWVGSSPNYYLPVPWQSAASISLALLTRGAFLQEKVSETR